MILIKSALSRAAYKNMNIKVKNKTEGEATIFSKLCSFTLEGIVIGSIVFQPKEAFS